MIRMVLALCLVVFCGLVFGAAPAANADIWRPAPGHVQTPIWPGTPPDPPAMPGPETAMDGGVTNVSQPTIRLYAPRANATGTAVVVIPGGGFQVLAMDLEGTEICDWLTSMGVACVLLKYRVPTIPYVWQCKCRPHNKELSRPSLQDVQRSLRVVRAHAGEWRIDPHKIGVIGFSAGGYLVAEASTWFDERLYSPQDAADKLSARPDFAMAIYPGHLSMARRSDALNPLIESHITARTPPSFLVQAEDDHVDRVEDTVSYAKALIRAGVPAELHTFAHGGHAFGLRPKGLPIDQWPKLAELWMHKIGMLGPKQR